MTRHGISFQYFIADNREVKVVDMASKTKKPCSPTSKGHKTSRDKRVSIGQPGHPMARKL